MDSIDIKLDEKNIITKDFWVCHGCSNKYIILNSGENQHDTNFFQVDLIDGKYMLVSNYHQQRYVEIPPDHHPVINAPYCNKCVDVMNGLQVDFDPEPDYTFVQEGYTCVDIDRQENFKEHHGECVRCKKKNIRRSCFCWKPVDKNNEFYILWTSTLASRMFPCPLSTQVLKSSISHNDLYEMSKFPGYICYECLKDLDGWDRIAGPIYCPLCNCNFNRWIFHNTKHPVINGNGCYSHEIKINDKVYVADSYIDPVFYTWNTKERPVGYSTDKPFCTTCLHKLIKEGKLICEDSSDDDYT